MTGKAEVFTERDYGGASADLDVGRYNLGDGTGSVRDDTISSLKIQPGYKITVYSDRDCQGTSSTFTADTPALDSLDDAISSVEVAQQRPPRVGVPPQPIPDSIVFVQPPPVV